MTFRRSEPIDSRIEPQRLRRQALCAGGFREGQGRARNVRAEHGGRQRPPRRERRARARRGCRDIGLRRRQGRRVHRRAHDGERPARQLHACRGRDALLPRHPHRRRRADGDPRARSDGHGVGARRFPRAFADAGIPFACVSLGADGSLAMADGKSYRVHVPRIACKNPVGSGDSFVGGYATAIAQGKSPQEALRLAAACGTANAMEEESGFVRREVVEELLPQIEISEV